MGRVYACREGLFQRHLRAEKGGMVWFYARGPQEYWTCETRLSTTGDRYELHISDETGTRVESFPDAPSLLARELDLLAAWRALGWQPMPRGGFPFRTPVAQRRSFCADSLSSMYDARGARVEARGSN